MDFALTEEQSELVAFVKEVTDRGLRPRAFERRLDHGAPLDDLAVLGDAGILGLCFPEKHGGGDRSALDAILMIEAVAHASPSTAEWAIMSATGPALFISRLGSEYLQQKYIDGVISGRQICSISLTEPEAGTSLTDLQAKAEIRGDKVILNGSKIFCSFAPYADWFLVYVRFGEGTRGIGAVIVDKHTPGFTVGKTYEHMAGTPWAELHFADAEIPVENILVQGDAFGKLMQSYSLERCSSAALVLGVAQLALDMSVSYAVDREQFGRPIVEFQMIQSKLADMYIALTQAKLLTYLAVSEASGLPTRMASSAAKVAATEAAAFITDQAMQIHGGSGMTTDTGLEWLYRIVRPHQVAGGTSEIHRSMIAAELVGRRLDHRRGA